MGAILSDMSKHKIASLIKSGVRILGCLAGMHAFMQWAGVAFALLFIAEIIGIIEEEFA